MLIFAALVQVTGMLSAAQDVPQTFLTALAAYGPGGLIALIVIYLWRGDRQGWATRYEEDRKASEERLVASEMRYFGMLGEFRKIIMENTEAVTAMKVLIQNGHLGSCPLTISLPKGGQRLK